MKIHLEQPGDVAEPSNHVLSLHQLVEKSAEDGPLSASGAPPSLPALAVAWDALTLKPRRPSLGRVLPAPRRSSFSRRAARVAASAPSC